MLASGAHGAFDDGAFDDGAFDDGAFDDCAFDDNALEGAALGSESGAVAPHADVPHADAPHADVPHADAPHADALDKGTVRLNALPPTHAGALTQTYCALSDEIPQNNIRGQFFVPIAGFAPHDEHVNNRTLTSNLYEMSLRLIQEFVVEK